MSLTRALAWNTSVQIAGKVVSTALGVVSVGIMTRYLGQSGFGAYSTANAYLQIFALLLDLGLNVTIVNLLGEHAGDKTYQERAVSALSTLRIATGLLVFALAVPIAWLFPYSLELKLSIVALTGSFFFASLNQIVIGVQQTHLKMHVVALAENAGRLVLIAGLLVARAMNLGLVPVVLFVSLAGIANFSLNFIAARRFASFRWNWDLAYWKIALARSWPIGVSIAFNLIYYKADTLILSLVRSQSEVGIYGAAYRVLDILISVPFMYAGVLLPVISHAWARNNREYFSHLLGRSIDLMMLLAAPLIASVWVLGTRIMTLVAGREFALSGSVLNILILAGGIIYLHTIFSYAVVALNLQRKMIPIYIAVALVTLAAYVIFIPMYGLWAAAWLTVFSEAAIGTGSMLMTRSRAPLSFHPRVSAIAVGAALVMALAIKPLAGLPLPIPIGIGIIVYGALVTILGGIPRETIKELLSLKQRTSLLP